MSILTSLRNAQKAVNEAVTKAETSIQSGILSALDHDVYEFRSLAAIQKAVPGVTREDILATPGVRTSKRNPNLFTTNA